MNALVIMLQAKKDSFVFQLSVCSNFRKFESYILCINELDFGFNLPVLDFLWLKTKASELQKFEYPLLGSRQ